MRRALPITIALLLAVGGAARAQTMMPGGTGSCSGGMLAGTVGIAFVDSSGNQQSVQAASVPYAFNGAECTCNTQDLLLDIFLTSAFPMATTGTAEFWVGSGCDTNNTTRTTVGSTICQKVSALDISRFVTGSTTNGAHVYIPIPSVDLFAPGVDMCPAGDAANALYVLFFLTGAPTSGTPSATCSLQLTEKVLGPGAPQGVQPLSGDSAVTLNWSAPSSTQAQPQFYQVLCADANGNPVPGKASTQIYSTCVNGQISRRPLPTGGSISGGGGTDLGTAEIQDLSTASEPLGAASLPQPAPQATADGGTGDGGTSVDGGAALGVFSQLDPRFICTGQIPLGSGGGTVRIDGLTNGVTYQFLVLGVDNYGNATPAANVVNGTPQPVEDLYRRFRDQGGRASGFCFIATAAFGSYENRYVRVLRDFRDDVLLPTRAGAAFVDWYYAHSPRPAAYIAAHPAARIATQLALWPIIGAVALWLYTAAWLKGLAAALACAWVVRRRLARRAA